MYAYLVWFKVICVQRQPSHKVSGQHISRATSECRVHWGGVVKFPPLPHALHRPISTKPVDNRKWFTTANTEIMFLIENMYTH